MKKMNPISTWRREGTNEIWTLYDTGDFMYIRYVLTDTGEPANLERGIARFEAGEIKRRGIDHVPWPFEDFKDEKEMEEFCSKFDVASDKHLRQLARFFEKDGK